jgi:methionyl-tRNA formyltransferase
VRLIFLGSPPFATPVLAALLGSRFRPVAVVTQPARARGRGQKLAGSAVAELARAAGVELLEPESVREPAVLARLAALEPDVFLVVSYGEILRAEFLGAPAARVAQRAPLAPAPPPRRDPDPGRDPGR